MEVLDNLKFLPAGLMRMLFAILFSCLLGAQALTAADALSSCNIPGPIDRFLNCFALEQEKQKLFLVTKSVEGDCETERIGLLFDYYEPMDEALARGLIIQTVQSLLDAINADSKLIASMGGVPLTENDVVVRIRHRLTACYHFPVIGNIAYVTSMDGWILYDTINSYTYDINPLRTERFSRAQALQK